VFINALPDTVQRLLTELGQERSLEAFYLAGGTAVALRLGHRISVDLDFFTSRRDFDPERLCQDLAVHGHIHIDQQDRRTVLGRLKGVKFSFIAYPYPLIEETESFQGIRVAHLLDLALMKIVATSQRGTRRDFVDLFYLCRQGLRLADLIPRLPEKFKEITYPFYHVLRSLVFFDDAELDEPPQMLLPLDWEKVKSFFRGEVRALHAGL
jgi:predicted nucleotidyltransferase component of viral defense system